MKRVLTVLLALVMVFSLAACAASNPTTAGKNEPTNKPTNGTTKPTTGTTVPSSTVQGTTAQPTVPTEPTYPTATNKPVEPEAIFAVENEHFSFNIVSTISTEEAYILVLSIANKTGAMQSYTVNNVSANDYVCTDVSMYCDVNGNETMTAEVVIPRSVLDTNGITDPTKIEFTLFVMNGETWAELYNAPCTLYPMGKENHVDDGGYTAQEGDTVLVDNEYCTVIVTDYDPTNEMGYVVNMYVANKTDKSLLIAAEGVTVNDLMFDPWWSVEVPAGKRCVSQMIWRGNEFATYGIGDITKIDFLLTAKDPMDWESPDFANASCTLYPMGEEAYQPFERPTLETDIVLMDNEYVTIIATSIGLDVDGNYTMNLYIQNKSDSNIFVKPNAVCINDVELDPWWGTTVTAGKATFGTISWFASDLEFNGITAVEAITMTMNIFDELGENTFVSEEITINP